MTGVEELLSADVLAFADDLADLLVDAVDGGASVGFLAPLPHGRAAAWWKSRAAAVANGVLSVWVARVDGRIAGTVQVASVTTPNGTHRAEVLKLLVHRDFRGRGLGRDLLATAEKGAAAHGASLLVLDTQTGSPAEGLYRSAGWTEAGVIPDYAADPSGVLRPTTLFYKRV
ncbi:GNAT family N-acetyltransferase [Saccharothrix variisporea]|uniref:Ribosomal protein S18 acetylase RimI-like enzyme n=1 Tax=Saccharothrix variisporea TaxID=543527 RepID=A0A495XK31_9PSEU|nr:GNAT family N-acetyltransferase [Saccharothrix variisporea]RKT72763.1 ribosomal protein S18 acetylase RimI-like enzyme [Saccharothrix variisporea]